MCEGEILHRARSTQRLVGLLCRIGNFNALECVQVDMRFGRRVRWVLFLAGLYLTVCTVAGIYLAEGPLHPARRALNPDEVTEFENAIRPMHAELGDVSITTPDHTILRAWLVRPEAPNGNAAVVLHGMGDNRLGMSGYARLLLARGYSVLLPDARAHGESGGALATHGLLERADIRQWVEFLMASVKPLCVYGLGESMGASLLLQSLDAGSQFCALVAESPLSSFREIAYDRMGQPFHLGPWVGRTIFRPIVEIGFLRARWKYGLALDEISPQEAVAHSRVPVLLIHGQIDTNIPVRHSRAIHARAPSTVLWEVPGADHCGAVAMAPAEFENRVTRWFEESSVTAPKRTTRSPHERHLNPADGTQGLSTACVGSLRSPMHFARDDNS